ncbi:MAG: hypothetical protein U1E27_01760, partial [Kiritimatiellia bacterium]|nr:hypothetical protein [Kiritimatiellia bacterium]
MNAMSPISVANEIPPKDALERPHPNAIPIQFRLTPQYWLAANQYALNRTLPGIVRLSVRNETGYQPRGIPRMIVELPPDLEWLGGDFASKEKRPPETVSRDGSAIRRYEWTIGLASNILRSTDFISHSSWRGLEFMIRNVSGSVGDIYIARAYYADDGGEGERCEFHIRIVDDPLRVENPVLFQHGYHSAATMEFYGPGMQAYAEAYARCGFNVIGIPAKLRALSEDGNRDPGPILQAMRNQGVTPFLITGPTLANVYQAFEAAGNSLVPEPCRFQTPDGRRLDRVWDPAYIIEDGSEWRTMIQALLNEYSALGVHGLLSNWEPHEWVYTNGCDSVRSRKQFSERTGISYESIRDLSLARIAELHKDPLIQFQRWQMIEVNRRMIEEVERFNQTSGRMLLFVPALGPPTLADEVPDSYWHADHYRAVLNDASILDFRAFCSWSYIYVDAEEYRKDPEPYRTGLRRPEFNYPRMKGLSRITHYETLYTVEKLIAWMTEKRKERG